MNTSLSCFLGALASLSGLFAVCLLVRGRTFWLRSIGTVLGGIFALIWSVQTRLNSPLDFVWLEENVGFLREDGVLRTGLTFIGWHGGLDFVAGAMVGYALTLGKPIRPGWTLIPLSLWLSIGLYADWEPVVNALPWVEEARLALGIYRDPWAGITPQSPPLSKPKNRTQTQTNRPVIIVMVESLTRRWLGKSDEHGQEITPILNQLTNQADYWPNYLSSASYTIKAQESLLGSWIKSGQEQINEMPNLQYTGLATYLRQHGYQTVFMQGTASTIYGQTHDAVMRMGFERILNGGHFRTETTQVSPGGWGIDDISLYRGALREMDAMQTNGRPIFACIVTIENHYPFIEGAKNGGEISNYQKSIHRADQAIGVLLEEIRRRDYLKDAIVVLTGDHAFLCGEFKGVYNLSFPYQEAFLVPLYILNGNQKGEPHPEWASHIDVAPSISDLLGLTPSTDWMGRTLYQPTRTPFVILTQPFGGNYLALVEGTKKLVIEQRRGRILAYPLDTEGKEQFSQMLPMSKEQLARLAYYR